MEISEAVWLGPNDRLGCCYHGCKRASPIRSGGNWWAMLGQAGGLSYLCRQHANPNAMRLPDGARFVKVACVHRLAAS